MIIISFNRESVSRKDEENSCIQRIVLDDDAVLSDLVFAIIRGGSGNEWPIPPSPEAAYWAIRSDMGVLAYYSADGLEERIDYPNYDPQMKLKNSEIWGTFASLVRKDEIGIIR